MRTIADLSGVGEEWDSLLEASRSNTIFLSRPWIEAWLAEHDVEQNLLAVSVRDDAGRLAGLALHYIAEYGFAQVVPYRVLRILGDTDCGAEYQTWLARAGDEARVCAEVARALAGLRSEWDLVWLPRQRIWSGAHEEMIAAMSGAGFAVNTRASVFSAIALPKRFDEYLARLSPSRRQQIRRMTRRILGRPGAEVRKVTTRDDVGPALEALFELHGKRWRAAGEQGAFVKRPKEKAFYRRFVPRALEQGWLAFYLLTADGEPKAAQVGYAYDGAFLQLQEGFDPDYSPHAGNVLRAHAIEDCIAHGIREYDFLGGITDHKRRWLAEERYGADVLAAVRSWRNLPVVRGRVWPTGRYLRPRPSTQAA